MRTITTLGYTITYPSKILWLNDINKIKIEASSSGFSSKIKIQNPYGEISTLEYTTRTNSILYILDDNLKYLYMKGNFDWSVSVFVDGVQIHSFSCKVLDGKSFLNKTHGSSDVIYYYPEEEGLYDTRYIEVYSPNDGVLLGTGNTAHSVDYGWNRIYLPSINIVGEGDYLIYHTNRVRDSITSQITGDIGISPSVSEILWDYETFSDRFHIDGGTMFEKRQIFPQVIKIHYIEPCQGDVVLRYTNCDGCTRYICGKLLEEKDEFKPTKLNNVIRSQMYKFNPSFTNNNNSKTLKIGIYEVEAGAEINDIIFSRNIDILDINNEWSSCVLKTNSVTNYKNNGFDNLEFEIIISEI